MNGADSPVVPALAVVFGAVSVLLAVLGVLYSPVAFGVAIPFAIATYVLWYHASGRLHARARASASRVPPGGMGRSAGSGRFGTDGRSSERRRPPSGSGFDRQSRAQAYRVLGLTPGASRADVRRAYRERAKTAHPDRGGDEREFRRLTAAYERLTDDG